MANPSDRATLELAIRKVFKDLPPIADEDLCAASFTAATSSTEGLEALRGKSRYALAAQQEWVDFGVLYRMSPYAVWYFAPSLMLMALRHIDQYEFWELMQAFRYPDVMMDTSGYSSFPGSEHDADDAKLDVSAAIALLTIDECLARKNRDSVLNLHWFACCASFYAPVEKKLVASFLLWLQATKWPDEPSVALAIKGFWSR